MRGGTPHVRDRTETRRVSEETAWLVSRTFYDPKGRAVVTTDSFVEDAGATAANAAAFNPETGTYSSFSFDNATAATASYSVYDGAGRVVRTYRLKDVTIAVVTTAAGAATVHKTELRIGAETFIAPTEAAPNEALYETYFRELTEFFEAHGAIVSSSETQYDNAGRVTVSTDRFGRQTNTAYNAFGETIETRTQSVDAAGQPVWLVARTVYDDYGRVELTTDRYVEGSSDPVLATRTIYDEKGRAVKTLRLEGVHVALVDGDTAVSGWGSEVWRTETVYDAKGRAWKSIGRHDASDPNSPRPTTEYEYDSLGRQIASVGPAVRDERTGELVRHRTESKYDSEGRLQETWANVRVVVDAQGNVLSTNYTDKQVTAFEYDAYGRTTKTIYGVGSPIESYVAQGYDDYGRVIWESEQAPAGEASPLKRQFEYDDFGCLTAVVLPAVAHPTLIDGQNPLIVHPRYEYGYDARGNHVSIRDNVYQTAAGIFYEHGGAAGDFSQAFDTRVTELAYDAQGRQTARALPLGVATPANSNDFVERKVYSDRSLAAATAAPANEPIAESVALGQLEYELSFEGVVTAYRYDNSTTGGGRLAAKHYYGGASAVAAYLADAADGSLTAANEAVKYGYDAFGRQAEIIQDGDGDFTTAGDQRVTITEYDIYGNIAMVASPAGVLNYAYDAVTGQQTRTWSGTDSNAPITDTRYVYDTLGRLDAVESHYRFGTQLDADANQSGFQPEVTNYVYDLVGNLAQTRVSNGVVSDYVYDPLNRLVLLRHYNDDGDHVWEDQVDSLLSEFGYTVRADGKRTAVDESVYDGISTKTTRVDWVYDNIGRLVQEDYDADGTDLDFTADYLFDLVGNRLEKTVDRGRDAIVDEIFSYEYDLNDRLLTETLDHQLDNTQDRYTEYGYDNTQQTSKTVHAGADANAPVVESHDYTFNLQGRMDSAEVSRYDSGATTLEQHERETYEYDDSGIRAAKTVEIDVNTDGDFDDAGTDTTTRTDYHVDKQNHTGYAQVLEEMQGDVVQKSWTIGHDVFLEAVAANQLRHLLKDGHGSTRQLVDALGNVIQNGQTPQVFAYDAYGVPIGFTLANPLTALLYSGEMTDQLTGLQYLRARYYNPSTGTFNRLDPFAGNFSDPQSLHKYLYTHGNPVNGIDPTGFMSLGQTIAVIGIALNFLSFGINVTNASRAYGRHDIAEGNEAMGWAMVDLLCLMLPFSGPGPTAAREAVTNTGWIINVTTLQLSRLGVEVSATWGYMTTLVRTLVGLDFNIALASGSSGGGGSSSGSASNSDLSSGSWGDPPHNVTGRATKYQERIARTFGDAPPAPGQEFQLGGKWFDGVKRSANKLLEAKGEGYAQILRDLVDKKNITGPLDELAKEMEGQAKICREFGTSIDWHVAEEAAYKRLKQVATDKGVTDVVTVIYTK